MNLSGHRSESPDQKKRNDGGSEPEKQFVFHHLVLREMAGEVLEKDER
jgi:hypothetical protein